MKNDQNQEPVEEKSSSIKENLSQQGVDQDPAQEQQKGGDQKLSNDDLKGKEVDRKI